MGLDLALGAVILLGAVRGWLKGFARQAISLVALVGSVYLASPIRDAARPYAREFLPSMHPDILDRLLWWSSAVVSFVALAGVGAWVRKLKRRPAYVPVEPNRANQGAGFLLGALKATVVACFLTAAFSQFAPKYVPEGGVVEAQTKSSLALSWHNEYRPAERIWNSPPVQSFVAQVRRNGLGEFAPDAPANSARPSQSATVDAPASKAPAPKSAPDNGRETPVKTARRGPELSIPSRKRLDPRSATYAQDLAAELERIGIDTNKSR